MNTKDAIVAYMNGRRPEPLRGNGKLKWSVGIGTDVWQMFLAAITGDTTTIERLLEKDPNLVRGAYEYRRPMYFAVRENQVEAARLLIEYGAEPFNAWGDDTLLDIARDRGYADMLKLLENELAKKKGDETRGSIIPAAIRERDLGKVKRLLDESPELLRLAEPDGNQPIHWAVMTRQLDMIDELLSRGANINSKRFDGALPIQLCNGDYSYRGWRDVPNDVTTTPRQVLDHLRARGAYCDICTASYIGDMERVKELLMEDPTLANRFSDYVTYYACSGTPLRNAALGGHIEIVRLLLDHGADPNLPEEGLAPDGYSLHLAVYSGNIEIAKLLLERGAYPNPEIESSADTLSAAMARSDNAMIELLCSYGAARNVHLLAYSNDISTAAAVFKANPSLANNVNALENAASQGHGAFVRLMLQYQPELAKRIGVGVRVQGPDEAVKSGELREYLFSKGMNANFSDWLGVTPLHRFAKRDDIDNAMAFLDHGADLNARDYNICSTPLGWAAKAGKIRMVEFLLQRGAKTNLPDDPSWATPLAWATSRKHDDVIQVLKKHGAK